MGLHVRSAVHQDADELGACLRSADLREITAVTTDDPVVILERGITQSVPCLAIVDEYNDPIALFGVVPDSKDNEVGRIWLLGSEALVTHSYAFLRLSRKWIDKLLEHYRVLWNTIDARNDIHIRWLKWCGFQIIATLDRHGVEQRPFYEFEITRNHRSIPQGPLS